MPSHGHYGETRGVRWNPDIDGFEMRCDDCARYDRMCYWPLTLEFWNPRTMQRCRACDKARRARTERKRHNDLSYAERRRLASADYYRKNRVQLNAKNRARRKARREARIAE